MYTKRVHAHEGICFKGTMSDFTLRGPALYTNNNNRKDCILLASGCMVLGCPIRLRVSQVRYKHFLLFLYPECSQPVK